MAKEQDFFAGVEEVNISTLNLREIFTCVAAQAALNYHNLLADHKPVTKAAIHQEKDLPITCRLARKVARALSLEIDEISIMSDNWREEVGVEDPAYIAVRAATRFGAQYYLVPQIWKENPFKN